MMSSVVLVSFCALAGCDETSEAHYQNFEDAVSAGAISRDWIPALLPKSAFDIHEMYNIDTNNSMLAFRFSSADKIDLGSSCEQIDPFKPEKPPFKVSWWPSDVPASELSAKEMGSEHSSC